MSLELDRLKERYERVLSFDDFFLNISVRYRLRSDRFRGGDILVTMKLESKPSRPNIMTTACLYAVEKALDDFFNSLREEYDSSEQRLIFISVHSPAFTSDMYLGWNELYCDYSIANNLMQSLALTLQSFQSLTLQDAALEFKITVLSRQHADNLRSKVKSGKKLPKNILSHKDEEEKLVGFKSENGGRKARKSSVITTPVGYPANPLIFEKRLVIIFSSMYFKKYKQILS